MYVSCESNIMFEQNLMKVSVDGEMVKSNELFSEELSMTELKVLLYVCVMIYMCIYTMFNFEV